MFTVQYSSAAQFFIIIEKKTVFLPFASPLERYIGIKRFAINILRRLKNVQYYRFTFRYSSFLFILWSYKARIVNHSPLMESNEPNECGLKINNLFFHWRDILKDFFIGFFFTHIYEPQWRLKSWNWHPLSLNVIQVKPYIYIGNDEQTSTKEFLLLLRSKGRYCTWTLISRKPERISNSISF